MCFNPELKICKVCGVEKSFSNFAFKCHRGGKDYWETRCRDCKKIYDKNHRQTKLKSPLQQEFQFIVKPSDCFSDIEGELKKWILLQNQKQTLEL
jgi:hypothetical protein